MDSTERDAVIRGVAAFMAECVDAARADDGSESPDLRAVLKEHLGQDPGSLPVVGLLIQPHQFVNLDVAVKWVVEAHGGGG
jgi:hypothetical protein